MRYIDNVHQPFIFNYGEYVNILVTEIQEEKYKYNIRGKSQKDDKWKIKLLDENLELIDIKTMTQLTHENVSYHIFSECSPFYYNGKLSYVATCYTEEFKGKVEYFLLQGDIDFSEHTIKNSEIHGKYSSAIMKDTEIIYVDKKNNKVKSTKVLIPGFGTMLDYIVRVMGIDGSNNILITGVKNQQYKTIIWFYGTNNFEMLSTTQGNTGIYKSSIYGDVSDGMLVYTDKELPDNETKKYKLNINMGYKLI